MSDQLDRLLAAQTDEEPNNIAFATLQHAINATRADGEPRSYPYKHDESITLDCPDCSVSLGFVDGAMRWKIERIG